MSQDPTPALATYDLLNAALIAKLAHELGAPRLAARAARDATAHAERLLSVLTPDLARITPSDEEQRVGRTADLPGLLAQRWPTDDPEGDTA